MTLNRSRSLPLFLVLALLGPALLGAQTAPKQRSNGFRLFARAHQTFQVNRVSCGVDATGELCNPGPYESLTGAAWPKGSPQIYMYNSGLAIGGTIQDTLGWAWAGDTTGAFFYDPKGTTQHAQEVEQVWNYADADDRAHWPQAAFVPSGGDPSAAIYDPSLRGRATASEGDIWSLAWEGDPALSAGRPHPLGVAIETRGLAWNSPTWNNDILYFVHTIYNISSSCAADYAAVRPGMREELLDLGKRFAAKNLERTGVQIPACGYTLRHLYVGNLNDLDVSWDAGNNYGSVNLPFRLGYAYEDRFRGPQGGYVLPSDLRSPPFTNGYGFSGVQFLNTPKVAGVESGVALYSNYTSGGLFSFPQNSAQLYRHLTGAIDPALGDGLCNYGVPTVTHICFVKSDGASDTRAIQSTGPFDLPPGGSFTFVEAYLFAGAVATPTCPAAGCPSVLPGDPLRLTNASVLQAQGANPIDSIAGFRGYVDDNADGKVQPAEFRTVRGSLLGKAQLAQLIFDRGFLLPAAPVAPDFFLVPGDDQVSVLWRPSASETTGDLFFTTANDPASPAYDPNYRQFDVEGYRIYRGRVDDPTKLTLLAQYDYSGTKMRDYLGAVNPGDLCAPELGRSTTAQGCATDFSTPTPGSPYTAYVEHDVDYQFTQVRLGDRFLALDSTPFITAADTAVTGGGTGYPEISATGVPFTYVDKTAKNNLRYFYSVTAFDVNSIQSGPSSFESARVLKSVIPQAPGSNYESSAALSMGMFGRGVDMTKAIPNTPGINSTTGVFTGPARPATATGIGLVGDLLPQLLAASGESSLILDSMTPGSAYDLVATKLWFTISTPAGDVAAPVSVIQDQFSAEVQVNGTMPGPPIAPAEVARYGGSGSFAQSFAYYLGYAGNYYTAAYGRGCLNAAPGFQGSFRCAYNGARWFDGPEETFPHPNRGNGQNTPTPGSIVDRTNAGSLAGVANVYEARSYQTRPNFYREVEGVLGTIATAADYRLHWGPGGTVDSVVDITHNVRLRFKNDITRGYTWGFLTQGAGSAGNGQPSGDGRNTVLSVTDLGCVMPIHDPAWPVANGHLACPGGTTYSLVSTVSFGPLAFGNSVASDATVTPTTNQGFGIYLAGHFFLMEMNSAVPTPPAAGTVWTLRTYVGAINGGGGSVGTAGNLGTYYFAPSPSPFTAVGASLTARYTVTNAVHAATRRELDAVHTIPDPYYLGNGYETNGSTRVIKFVDLPTRAIIRIYTLSGILVRVIEHNSEQQGGAEDWDVRNRDGRLAGSGVYFYHIEAPSGARRVGRMTLVTSGR